MVALQMPTILLSRGAHGSTRPLELLPLAPKPGTGIQEESNPLDGDINFSAGAPGILLLHLFGDFMHLLCKCTMPQWRETRTMKEKRVDTCTQYSWAANRGI